jgi:hypothetical protein
MRYLKIKPDRYINFDLSETIYIENTIDGISIKHDEYSCYNRMISGNVMLIQDGFETFDEAQIYLDEFMDKLRKAFTK